MSLIIPGTFQHILRVMNTNIDGKRNIMFAMTAIKGCGRRYANLVLKKVRLLLIYFVCRCIGELQNPDFYLSVKDYEVKWALDLSDYEGYGIGLNKYIKCDVQHPL